MIRKPVTASQNSQQQNPWQKEAIDALKKLIPTCKKEESFMTNSKALLEKCIEWKGNNQKDQFKNIFVNQNKTFKAFETQQSYQSKQFLCAKIFQTGIAQQIKKYTVYHCLNCELEYNSILCSECFDFKKHQGHKFQKTVVEGGCCDCGDHTKWTAQTFCEKHKYSNQPKKKLTQFDQEKVKQLTKDFQTFYLYHTQVLSTFYQNYMQRKENKQDKDLLQIMLNIIDIYGAQLIKSFIEINKNRAAFNEMTLDMFKRKITLSKPFKFMLVEKINEKIKAQRKTAQVKLLLFSFFELKETSKCISELFTLLCYRQDEFRKQITVQFIKRYNQHPQFLYSGYQQLAPQLLPTSTIIKALIKQSRMRPLLINFQTEGQVQEDQIRIIMDKLELFYRDISYLTNMKDQAPKLLYWQLFASYKDHCYFQDIAPHAAIFRGNQHALKYINKNQYKIEHTCIKKIIQIAKLMANSKVKVSQERIISKLFLVISSDVQKDENDLFFTYERIWTIFTFIYLTKVNDKNISFSQIGTITQMQPFINTLKKRIQNKDNSITKDDIVKKYLLTILKKLIRYWHRVCFIVRNGKDIQEKEMFYRYYLKDDNLLFNLDSLLFKLIIRVFAYYQQKQKQQKQKQQKRQKQQKQKQQQKQQQQKQQRQEQQQIQEQKQKQKKQQMKKQDKITPPQNYVPQQYKETQKINPIEIIIKNEFQFIQECINTRLNQVKPTQIQKLDSVTFLLNFINLLSQVIYSDIPELSLSTNFEKIHNRQINKNRILQIYMNYYQLLTNNNITKRQFKDLIEYLFLQEAAVFNNMCKENTGDDMHLVLKTSNKKLINLKYLQSQKYKLRNTTVINMLVQVEFYQNHPFVRKKNPAGYNLLKVNKIWQMLNDWLKRSYRDNVKSSQKYSYHLINQITQQYLRLMYLLRDPEVENLIRTSYSDHQIHKEQILQLLTKNNKATIQYYLSNHSQSQMQSERSSSRNSRINNGTPADENSQNMSQESSYAYSPSKNKSASQMQSQIKTRKQFQKMKTIDPKICNICRDDALPYLSNCFLFYYVRWSNLQGIGIDKNQKIMVFNTCGHYFHKQCLQKQGLLHQLYQIKGKCQKFKCPKCKCAYNFTMQVTWADGKTTLPHYENDINNPSLMRSTSELKYLQEMLEIKKPQFDIAKQMMKIESSQSGIVKEMIKSIIGNTLYTLNLKNTEIKQQFLTTFQCLWERLKCLQQFERTISIQFKDKTLQMHQQITGILAEIIFGQCSQLGKKTLGYLFHSIIIERLRQYINNNFNEDRNKSYFKLINLPERLGQLQVMEKKQSCSICEKKGHTLYVCLINRGQLIFKICQKCENEKGKKKQKMIRYIQREHLNECIFIRTDNGRIYYYALAQSSANLKIYSYPSVYVNKVGQAYNLGQYHPKKQYDLDREELRKIQAEFFSLKKMSQV